MRHLDLFSGIGGFALAAQWVWGDEHEIVSFCDNDKAAQVVLSKHWPGVPIHDDIKTLDATKWRGRIGLLTGGPPCQPFSCAGKRRGREDDRYLWNEVLRIIRECNPDWVLIENASSIREVDLYVILSGLESMDFTPRVLEIPACAVGAPHRRHRTWIVANSNRNGRKSFFRWRTVQNQVGYYTSSIQKFKQQSRTRSTWPSAPDIRGMDDGLPYRVHRLRLLGNAIVPQVAAEIFKAMKAVDV